uniref:RNA-directed DNA polymerase n=1 Tax=Steinernema glaseri TaxID=37863 RepID=A0A1I8ARA4_9BILA
MSVLYSSLLSLLNKEQGNILTTNPRHSNELPPSQLEVPPSVWIHEREGGRQLGIARPSIAGWYTQEAAGHKGIAHRKGRRKCIRTPGTRPRWPLRTLATAAHSSVSANDGQEGQPAGLGGTAMTWKVERRTTPQREEAVSHESPSRRSLEDRVWMDAEVVRITVNHYRNMDTSSAFPALKFPNRRLTPRTTSRSTLRRTRRSDTTTTTVIRTASKERHTTCAEKVTKRLYWPAMKEDIKKVVTACDICQRRKGSATQVRREPMQVSWKVDRPNEHLHTDLMGPLPITEAGNRYVLITIDAFSKFLTATALPDQMARTVAEALVNEVFLIHSIPKTISTDNGSNFCSELFEELCQLLGTRHVRTTPYHAQSNGQAERSVQSVKNMLSTMVTEGRKEWDSYVKSACFAYNTSVHATTKQIPFYLTFGRDARLPIDADWNLKQHDKLLHTEYQATVAERLQTAWESTRRTIQEEGEKNKVRYDEEHSVKARPFSIGDLVLVKIPVRQQALEPKWKGPFRIIGIKRPNLFLMDPTSHKSSRIHIDRVKRITETAMLPLRLNDHGAEEESGPEQGLEQEATTSTLSRNSPLPDQEATTSHRRSPRLRGKPRPQYNF